MLQASPAPEELFDEVRVLRSEITSLGAQISLTREDLTKDLGVKFLLEEFDELGEFWRHADARVESALNIYLTGGTIIVSAVILLAQRITELSVFLTVAIFVAIGLAMSGIVLARRITGAEIIKAEYIYALELIRRFFVDNAAEITPYLVLPFVDSPPATVEGLRGPLRATTSQILLTAINLWASLLLGFSVAAISWLVVPNSPLIALVAVGVLVAALSIGYLSIALKLEVQSHASALEMRYRTQHESEPK